MLTLRNCILTIVSAGLAALMTSSLWAAPLGAIAAVLMIRFRTTQATAKNWSRGEAIFTMALIFIAWFCLFVGIIEPSYRPVLSFLCSGWCAAYVCLILGNFYDILVAPYFKK